MSAPRLTNGRWVGAWSINVHGPLAAACDPQRLVTRVQQALTARRCTPIPRAGVVNPVAAIVPNLVRARALVTVTAHMLINHPSGFVEGAILNQDVCDAFKFATGEEGAGLGTRRMAQAMTGCENIGETFALEPPITNLCADYRPFREGEWPTTGVTSALGPTLTAQGMGPVQRSNDPGMIGQHLRPHDGPELPTLDAFFRAIGRAVREAPFSVKIIGGAVLATGGAVAMGYALRPVADLAGEARRAARDFRENREE